MKWVFLAALLVFTPALAALLRSKPAYRVYACFVLGVVIYVGLQILTVAPIAWTGWPDPVKGVEVSILDALSIGLLASTAPVRISSTVKLSFALYCLALVISSLAGTQLLPASFYVWQVFRSVLLFLAVARVCVAVPQAAEAILAGLGVGLIYEAILVVSQFAHGVGRPGGTLGHSNFLGLTADFVLFPTVALMLGGRRLWLPGATLFAGLVIALLGGSRATIGIFAVGVILTVTFSIRHKPTSRKYAFAGAMALLLLMAVPGMIWANSRRSEAQKQSSDTDRTTMKLAARMIMADYPFGVGPNQYVVIANVGGYSERAGVAWNEDNRRAPVHNTYYLVAAEMGLIGLVAFLAVLGSFITLAFRMLRRHLPDINGELVPGLLVTFIVAAGHIAYEYVFMEAVTHYLFAICAGMLVAIAARANAAARRMTPAIPRPAALASNANAL